jgi:hypothetical protein
MSATCDSRHVGALPNERQRTGTVLALAGLLNVCCRSGAAFGTSSIAEHIGKQRRGAVQVTGLAIGHRLCFGIEQLATNHFP